METIVVENSKFEAHSINYVTPCNMLSGNITSHKVTPETFKKLIEELDLQQCNKIQYIDTIYRYNDLILVVHQNGHQECFLETPQIHVRLPEVGLSFIRKTRTPFPVTQFSSSTDYHSVRQILFVDYVFSDITVSLEIILKDVVKHRDPATELKNLSNSLSLSCKMYFRGRLPVSEVADCLELFF